MRKPFTQAIQVLQSIIIPDKQHAVKDALGGVFYAAEEQGDSYFIQIPSLMYLHDRFFSLSDAGQLIDELRDQYNLDFEAVGFVSDKENQRHYQIETTNPLKLTTIDPLAVHLDSSYFDIHFSEEKTTFIVKKSIPQSEQRRLDFIFNDILLERKPYAKQSLEEFLKKP